MMTQRDGLLQSPGWSMWAVRRDALMTDRGNQTLGCVKHIPRAAGGRYTESHPFRYSTQYTDTETGVVYLNEKEGMYRAEDVIYERSEAGLSVVQTGRGDRMRGTVEIHRNALTVQLELAIFDKNDRVTGYVPLPLNGVFVF
jgi:hypothetical protein